MVSGWKVPTQWEGMDAKVNLSARNTVSVVPSWTVRKKTVIWYIRGISDGWKFGVEGSRSCRVSTACLRSGAHFLEEGFGSGLSVEDVGGGEAGAAELGDSVAHLVELFGGVGVGVDDDFAAVLFGEAEI
jgi:hypothetical protein